MDTKQITTMIVGVAISVVLVAGLMVPVISSLGNSGDGSGYTNTGDYYYKTPVAGENHTISVTDDDNNVYVAFDGETLVTIDKGTDAWMVPLILTSHPLRGEHLRVLTYDLLMLEKELAIWDLALNTDGTSSDSVPYTYNITGDTMGNPDEKIICYFANEGSYVYSESPVIEPDQVVYGCQIYSTVTMDTDPIVDRYASLMGIGTINELSNGRTAPFDTEKTNGICAPQSLYDWTNLNHDTHDYVTGYDLESIGSWNEGDITVNTTETPEGVRLDGVTVKLTWANYEDSTNKVIETVNFNKFIVPVNVSGGGGSGISPMMMNLLSVIPLITVVGIIIGVVGYMRMRD